MGKLSGMCVVSIFGTVADLGAPILSQQRPYRKPTEPEWRQPGNWTCPGFVDTWVKLPMLREPIVARTVAA